MRSITCLAVKIAILIGLIASFSGQLAANDERTTQEILLGDSGIVTSAARFFKEQEEDRKEKYGAMGSNYIAVQREIYQGSNGGPVMDSLGFNIFNLVRNPYAQTLHYLVLMLVIMLFFVNMANPKKQRDPPAVAVAEFFKKVLIGLVVITSPGLIYATSMAVKNSVSIIVNNAVTADGEDPSGGVISDAYLQQMAHLSDAERASLLATQRAIAQAVADHFKMMVGGETKNVSVNNDDFFSEIEAYSLAYLGQLGAAYNARKPTGTIARDVFTIDFTDIGKLERASMITRLREHFPDVLIAHAILANNPSAITLNAPNLFYYRDVGNGRRQYSFSGPTNFDGNFGRRMKEAFEFRDELLKEYTKVRQYRGNAARAENRANARRKRAENLREQLMTEYYEKVYLVTAGFLQESLGGYLKQTPHENYVNQRLEFFGSSMADIELPGDTANKTEEFLLKARGWVRSIFLWIGFILIDGMIEITILLLWLTYPLWFFEPTAKAFVGRARQLVSLCIMTAVFSFLMAAAEALTTQVAYYFSGWPGDAVKDALGGGVVGSVIGYVTNKGGASLSTIPILVFYFVLVFFALWKTPKITSAIFKGGSIIGEVTGGVATAAAAGVMTTAALASGGAGAAGVKGLASRMATRRAMGGSPASVGAVTNAIAPAMPRSGAPAGSMGIVRESSRGPVSGIMTGGNNSDSPPAPSPETPEKPPESAVKKVAKTYGKVGKEAIAAIGSGGNVQDYFAMRKNSGYAGGNRGEKLDEDVL